MICNKNYYSKEIRQFTYLTFAVLFFSILSFTKFHNFQKLQSVTQKKSYYSSIAISQETNYDEDWFLDEKEPKKDKILISIQSYFILNKYLVIDEYLHWIKSYNFISSKIPLYIMYKQIKTHLI